MKYIFRDILFVVIMICSIPLFGLGILVAIWQWDISILDSIFGDILEGSFADKITEKWGN